uniref:NAC protein n=1 Tax=Lilium pumilum TaxID=82327 RepID=A0A4Y1P047_9LILI|nr:NAC protein [Lilium pumilum]
MQRSTSELDLPGFRFHPTEEELLGYYLRRRVSGKKPELDIIGTLNIYRHDPWDLPKLSKIGEREWYFFVPRDRRQSNGGRPNRTTQRGFWKATGSDRPVRSAADSNRLIGMKKTLVFYMGRAPRGNKTDWVMNEFGLSDRSLSTNLPLKEDIVLCKVYRKATSLKEIEKRAAMRVETMPSTYEFSASTQETTSNSEQDSLQKPMPIYDLDMREMNGDIPKEVEDEESTTSLIRSVYLPDLQVPKCNMGWIQDAMQSQLHSPWFEQWSPYTKILNF